MKKILFVIMTFVSLHLSAQIEVQDGKISQKSFTKSSILVSGHSQEVTRFKTRETSVQSHDSVEVFKTVSEVEYTISKNKLKRKVLDTEKERFPVPKAVSDVFADLTDGPSSSIFQPRKLNTDTAKDPGQYSVYECKEDNDGIRVIISELGENMLDFSFFGTIVRQLQHIETLSYSNESGKLYLENLKKVEILYSFTSGSKKKGTHRIDVVATIEML